MSESVKAPPSVWVTKSPWGWHTEIERPTLEPDKWAEYVPTDRLAEVREEVWDAAIMVVHETRRQTLSDSGDEIVRHDRLQLVRALEAARSKE